ncbi:MAG: hypothetical protein K5930_01135 [Treponemataceae bacterium]|nr:hypothetical protein [Treponemataceae bacterium]
MRKFILSVFVVTLLFSPLFSEEEEEYDDFDALFEEAAEDIVVEEAPVPTVVKEETKSLLKLTGSFSGKVGAACVYDDTIEETETESKFTPGGLIDLSNTLSLSVNPSAAFGLYGSVNTAFSSKFSLSVSSLYFNSLLFDSVFLSAGKKGISWGNLKIFPNTVLSDSGSGVSCEIRYPWKLGTITGVMLYNYNTYGTSASNFTWRNMNFAGACDITIFNTNINAFVRKYPEPDPKTKQEKADIITGLELKRTILGFDTYAQGVVLFKDEFSKVTATGGFYKLWDSITPNIGINIEYQYVFRMEPAKTENQHDHFIKVDFGIKKIGPSQNMKTGIKWSHDFLKESGNVDVAYIISSIIPYTEWTNGLKITYGGDRESPKFDFGTALSFSLSY